MKPLYRKTLLRFLPIVFNLERANQLSLLPDKDLADFCPLSEPYQVTKNLIFLGHHQMSIEKSLVSSGKSLYQEDFYGWLQETANLLKEHRFEKLDLENLIEEIETMGRSEKRELESRLTVIAEHLLKLTYWLTEQETNAQGWRSTVVEQRRQVQRLLKESPSLRRLIPEIWIDCYQAAREDTVRKYQLAADLFPIESPFSLEEILDYDYLP